VIRERVLTCPSRLLERIGVLAEPRLRASVESRSFSGIQVVERGEKFVAAAGDGSDRLVGIEIPEDTGIAG